MKDACSDFRARLERSLVGAATSSQLSQLGWHEHLLACPACRSLLESEQALEILLATLPEPELPPELSRRILARLRSATTDPLDALLEMDADSSVPPGLAERVLTSLENERHGSAQASSPSADLRLDALLDRAWGEVRIPGGLAPRVLDGLAAERRANFVARPRRSWARPRIRSMRGRVAAAALLTLGLGFALWRFTANNELSSTSIESNGFAATTPTPESAVPDELLASLDVLETWEELEASGILDGDPLASLDSRDAILLELLIEAMPDEFADPRLDDWNEEEDG